MDKTIKLTFLGDVMCKAQMLPAFATMGEYCFDSLFQPCEELFSDADYVFANLETPISCDNSGLTNEKYCFFSPYEFAQAAKTAGIDFVATANNHCLDRDIEGISSTIRSLNRIGLEHTGIFDSKEKESKILNVGGLRLGILSYTYGTNAFSNHNYLPFSEYWRVNLFQNQELSNPIMRAVANRPTHFCSRVILKILRLIHHVNVGRPVYERREFSLRCRMHLKKELRLLKKKADLILIYMHAGGQYNPEAINDTKQLVRFLFKNGVNIVAGSHEHVVHGGDFSRINENKLATYSLGNFDGVSGVYEEPFDKMAEYSVAWHIYVNATTNRIEKTSFSVLKTIPDNEYDGKIKTVPVFDFLGSLEENEKKQLLNDTIKIAKRFTGMDYSSRGMQKEYIIHPFGGKYELI